MSYLGKNVSGRRWHNAVSRLAKNSLLEIPRTQFQVSNLLGGFNLPQVQLLHFLSCPRSPAQEFQTGFDAGVVCEAAYWHGFSHRFPAHTFGQMGDDLFQCDAFQRGTIGGFLSFIHAFILQRIR